ncbi:MAG: zinc ribbon domain-containing protein [Weeksellaceae bacterium]|nr:zinc ribbon domain-containing protein [Weeksellaceae bacterium]
MFFFIFGLNRKPVGKEQRKIMKNGFEVNAVITVYKNYFELFFIPLIPLGKKYSIYIPHTDEYYEEGVFSKMPDEYMEICREVGRNY